VWTSIVETIVVRLNSENFISTQFSEILSDNGKRGNEEHQLAIQTQDNRPFEIHIAAVTQIHECSH
jgi:hypothetical protein